MCGIFGIVQPAAGLSELTILGERANLLQAHRGPDQSGISGENGWMLAHRRLSIFDVSSGGRQPFHGAGGLVLVFNGAIYNFPELRAELEAEGYTFTTRTDTEVLLSAYAAWGAGCFARFNGMWAVAILDPARGELTLARDRIGIKPLYVYEEADRIAFASETKALRRTVGRGDEYNHEVVTDFLLHGWQDHRPETIWAGIAQFPAGCFSTYDVRSLRRVRHGRYYEFPTEEASLTDREFKGGLGELFADSVRLRSRSDVGYGLTLSGGVDSSAIAGMLEEGRPTYSVRFPGTPYDESAYVDAVLRYRNLRNTSLTPEWEDFARDVRACTLAQDQPLASSAVVVHYTMMEMIGAAGETVLLNGQGADEIGGGYDKFYLPYLKENLASSLIKGLSAGFWTVRNLRLGPDQVMNRIQRLTAPAAPETFLAPAFSAQTRFSRQADTDVRQTSINLLSGVGLPNLLRHEDRNAMAHGIESRTPFLDYRLVDFMLAAPVRFKVRHGIRKWGIREGLKDALAPEVYARKRKLGFATPQTQWMSGQPDFFLGAIRRYAAQPDALLTAAAADFAKTVLRKKQTRFYPMVWRWWAWSNFTETIKTA